MIVKKLNFAITDNNSVENTDKIIMIMIIHLWLILDPATKVNIDPTITTILILFCPFF